MATVIFAMLGIYTCYYFDKMMTVAVNVIISYCAQYSNIPSRRMVICYCSSWDVHDTMLTLSAVFAATFSSNSSLEHCVFHSFYHTHIINAKSAMLITCLLLYYYVCLTALANHPFHFNLHLEYSDFRNIFLPHFIHEFM